MQGGREQVTNRIAQSTEDDMSEGDLGDGMCARSTSHLHSSHQSTTRNKGDFPDVLPQPRLSKRGSEESSGPFSWTSCSAMYTAFREDLEADRSSPWRAPSSDGGAGDSSEVLQRRLQEVTEEVELLRTELEVTHRHLEGKHEALRILQGQAILDKATSHTKTLLQKSEERTKDLEKEVNALQWEITFNQVQFKNVEHTWSLKCERLCAENKALSEALDKRLEQLHEMRTENTSLSQQCQELLGLLDARERRDFQRTQPPCSKGREGSSVELAVYGACQCVSGAGEACPCAKSAAASRKQVLQLQQELEQQRRRKEEAYVMMDAFRIAFEQQLRRSSEEVLRLAAGDGRPPHQPPPERGKPSSTSVAERLRRFLPSARERKIPIDPTETLYLLLDLLCDKEEALAHQRKVSYMLARSSDDLEKDMRELDLSSPAAAVEDEREAPVFARLHSNGSEACTHLADNAGQPGSIAKDLEGERRAGGGAARLHCCEDEG